MSCSSSAESNSISWNSEMIDPTPKSSTSEEKDERTKPSDRARASQSQCEEENVITGLKCNIRRRDLFQRRRCLAVADGTDDLSCSLFDNRLRSVMDTINVTLFSFDELMDDGRRNARELPSSH